MTSAIEVRKVIGGVILALLWICTFLLIKPTLVIDWAGSAQQPSTTTTPLLLVTGLVGLLVIIFYHMFYRSSAETNKLSWTAVLTLLWLSLIIFYPFKDPNNTYSGAVAFFTLLGGLAVCILWVRFFSDEIVVA